MYRSSSHPTLSMEIEADPDLKGLDLLCLQNSYINSREVIYTVFLLGLIWYFKNVIKFLLFLYLYCLSSDLLSFIGRTGHYKLDLQFLSHSKTCVKQPL